MLSTVYLCWGRELDRDDHLISAMDRVCYSHRSRDLGVAHNCLLGRCGMEQAIAHDDLHLSPTIMKDPKFP
jgi:hypothetical protein